MLVYHVTFLEGNLTFAMIASMFGSSTSDGGGNPFSRNWKEQKLLENIFARQIQSVKMIYESAKEVFWKSKFY